MSLDDDLLRIFGPQTMFSRLMNKNLEDGEAIVSPWISKAIETAQKKVEARNYDIRKQVVEFDDVMNDQRKVIYEQRADIMDADSVSDVITDMRAETIAAIVVVSCPEGTYPEQWNVASLKESINEVFGLQPPIDDWLQEEAVDPQMVTERLVALADDAMAKKLLGFEAERWGDVEKQILLQTLDHHWKDHLATLDALRQVIHLRSYAQKKPIDEYKQEAFLLFERLLVSIREEVTRILMRAQVQLEELRRPCFRTSSPSTSILSRAMTTRPTSTPPPARSCRTCRRSPASPSRRCRTRDPRRRGRSADQPQRAVSVRLGQEVQALPRATRVREGTVRAPDRSNRAAARLPA